MSKIKKNKILILVLGIILVSTIIISAIIKEKQNNKTNNINIYDISMLDKNDEAYNGMNIYEKNDSIVIEGQDESKTIEKIRESNSKLTKTTEEIQQKYQISDVEITLLGNNTKITGNIKNSELKTHNLVLNIKFYLESEEICGAASKKIKIKPLEKTKFEMETMGDFTNLNYKLDVEYSD